MQTKRVTPVLIPTDNPSFLVLGDILANVGITDIPNDKDITKQELILISLEDEKIEVGDIMYSSSLNEIDILDKIPEGDLKFWFKGIHKVIARQSQIPLKYISTFIKQYNNRNVKDIKIEMETRFEEDTSKVYSKKGQPAIQISEPKLTNGFVTIVKKEQITYTEKEIFTLGDKYEDYCLSCFGNLPKSFSDWFENNKKK